MKDEEIKKLVKDSVKEAFKEIPEEEKKKKLEKMISEWNGELLLFPGNKTEFEEIQGYKVSIYDTGKADRGTMLWGNFGSGSYPQGAEELMKAGVIGIIHYRPHRDRNNHFHFGYGLPVIKAGK